MIFINDYYVATNNIQQDSKYRAQYNIHDRNKKWVCTTEALKEHNNNHSNTNRINPLIKYSQQLLLKCLIAVGTKDLLNLSVEHLGRRSRLLPPLREDAVQRVFNGGLGLGEGSGYPPLTLLRHDTNPKLTVRHFGYKLCKCF